MAIKVKHTAEEKANIERAYGIIQRLVKSSNLDEIRLENAFKIRKRARKDAISSMADIVNWFESASCMEDSLLLRSLSNSNEEFIFASLLGVKYRSELTDSDRQALEMTQSIKHRSSKMKAVRIVTRWNKQTLGYTVISKTEIEVEKIGAFYKYKDETYRKDGTETSKSSLSNSKRWLEFNN